MIQTLKKYRFWVFSALGLLNIGLNMQGVEMPFPIDSLYLPLFLLAVMSVPDNWGKEKKQP